MKLSISCFGAQETSAFISVISGSDYCNLSTTSNAQIIMLDNQESKRESEKKIMIDEESQDVQRVKKAAEALGEHFDSVQIFANRVDAEGTISLSHGCGNWFARYGQIVEWRVKNDEEAKEGVRREE